MELGCLLHQYQELDIEVLLEALSELDDDFWNIDRLMYPAEVTKRIGSAVFLYHDSPYFAQRKPLIEARSGQLNVLCYPQRPLFDMVSSLIEDQIAPCFPGCQTMRVHLARLPAGQVLAPHRDMGILAKVHRTYLPLITRPDVKFVIGNEEFHLAQGTLYDLNNLAVHSVENASSNHHIHLVADLLPETVAKCAYHNDEDNFQLAIGEVVH